MNSPKPLSGPSQQGMQLFDAEGRRLYVTEEERRAFRAAASKAPREVVEPAVSRPELAFRIKLDELLGILGEAIARIEQRNAAEAALRELWATLLEVKATVARDPGIRMAADDLYEAAWVLVAAQSGGPETVDVRSWRLLKEADARLRDRLASARPSKKTQLLGLN